MEERHLSLSEAAAALDISERTAYRWVKSGKLRAYKPGRDYWIPESAIKELVTDSAVRPKTQSRSSLEPSLFKDIEDERRLRYLRGWRAFVNRLARRWEEEPPKTSAEITPLFEAMNAVVEAGIFESSSVTDAAEADNLFALTIGFKRLNDIADKVEKDEEAEQRRATLRLIQGRLSA